MTTHQNFDLQMSYLRAIQAIPGDTAGEKYRWIGRLASNQASGDSEQLPPELLPILRTETAVKNKRHEDITLALKSEDATIVNRAFKASWFFDGSHKKTIDVAYFCKQLFPYVSLKTRTRIIGTLAHRLIDKDPTFAQEIFTAVASVCGIKSASSLLLACDEAFVYETIAEKRFALSLGIIKKIFRKNPDLVVRFLRLLKPDERTAFEVDITRYNIILPKLIKKKLEAFVELYEMQEINPPNFVLSNTCAEIFLKKGLQHLLRKPLLYIRILPLKKINAELMETIFPNLLPEKAHSFRTDNTLCYLEHYPQDKRYELLRKSYKGKYGVELVDETNNVTPELLRILPTDERIKQARIKIARMKSEDRVYKNSVEYEIVWYCYLPINEAISFMKEQINKSPLDGDRLCYLRQMIYACKINEDEDALSQTLTYFINRHKNEDFWIFERTMDQVAKWYDAFHLSERNCTLLLDIIRLFYVKYGYATENSLQLLIHFKLLHNQPIEEEIVMLLETNYNRWDINFRIMQKYPQYDKQCLVTFAKIMEERYLNKQESVTEEKKAARIRTACLFVNEMYDFNDRCEKSRAKIEHLTIKDYPLIMDIVYNAIRTEHEYARFVKATMQKKERKLYDKWFPNTIADVNTGAALALLKRDPQTILNHWVDFFSDSKKFCASKRVQRFIRATRWYKDIPIKFATSCMSYLADVKKIDGDDTAREISSNLAVLAMLIQGDSLEEFITPFLPVETTTVDVKHSEARSNYLLVRSLPLSMRLSNPPISLDLVVKLCEGDYLTIGLMTLTNISKRSYLPNVMAIAKKLMNMRVGTRKHGIRLMYMIASIDEFRDFIREMWDTERHHSVREILFQTSEDSFITNPNSENWHLYSSIIKGLTLEDKVLFSKMTLSPVMPNEYVEKYLGIWLEIIEKFSNMGLDVLEVNKCIVNCLETLTCPIYNLLSEDFAADIIRNYLFHIDSRISEVTRRFAILYFLPKDKNKFVLRIVEFTNFFCEIVKNGWDKGHPKKSRFYPVNHNVRLFFDDLVVNYVRKSRFHVKTIDPEIIDDIQKIFLLALQPMQDPKSYIMLAYARTLRDCVRNEEFFDVKLAQQMPELIDTFSSLLIPFMVEVLEDFLKRVFGHIDLEDKKFSIIEGLIKSNSADHYFMAVNMLPQTASKDHTARYDQIVKKLREINNFAINSILNNRLNETDFEMIIFD